METQGIFILSFQVVGNTKNDTLGYSIVFRLNERDFLTQYVARLQVNTDGSIQMCDAFPPDFSPAFVLYHY